jgi:fibronectin-binding autotransporter adhesin
MLLPFFRRLARCRLTAPVRRIQPQVERLEDRRVLTNPTVDVWTGNGVPDRAPGAISVQNWANTQKVTPGNPNWSDPANWFIENPGPNQNGVPQNGDQIVFPQIISSTNNLPYGLIPNPPGFNVNGAKNSSVMGFTTKSPGVPYPYNSFDDLPNLTYVSSLTIEEGGYVIACQPGITIQLGTTGLNADQWINNPNGGPFPANQSTFQPNIELNAQAQQDDWDFTAGSTIVLLGNVLDDPNKPTANVGLLINSGANDTGTLVLSGSGSTYSGVTELKAGILEVAGGSIPAGDLTPPPNNYVFANFTSPLGQTGTTANVVASANTIVDVGATLQLNGFSIANETLDLHGDGVNLGGGNYLGALEGSGNWLGPVVLDGGGSLNTSGVGSNMIAANGTLLLSDSIPPSGQPATSVSGPGNLYADGSGTLVLNAANTYSGATTVAAGTLLLENGTVDANFNRVTSSLGTSAATDVLNGATLALDNNVNIADNALTIVGQGVGGLGAFQGVSSSVNPAILSDALTSAGVSQATFDTWYGTVTLAGNTTIGVDQDKNTPPQATTLKITGQAGLLQDAAGLQAGGGDLTKGGFGVLWLPLANDGFVGNTIINNGVIYIQNPDSLGPASLTPPPTGPGTITVNNPVGPTGATSGTLKVSGDPGTELDNRQYTTPQMAFTINKTLFLNGNGPALVVADAQNQVAITSAMESANTVTMTTAAPLPFNPGDQVTIAGFLGNETNYNGTYTVLSGGSGTTTFSYTDNNAANLPTDTDPPSTATVSPANVPYLASNITWGTAEPGGSVFGTITVQSSATISIDPPELPNNFDPTPTNGPTSTLTITGGMSGPGTATLEKDGGGTLILLGANPQWFGSTTLRDGLTIIDNALSLGPPPGISTPGNAGVTVDVGATLQYGAPLDIAGVPLTLNGSGFGSTGIGALDSPSGTSEWDGNITLAGVSPVIVTVDSGQLTFTGVLSGGAGMTLTSANPLTSSGTLVLAGTGTNTATGTTTVADGTLWLDKQTTNNPQGISPLAIDGPLVIGDDSTTTPEANASADQEKVIFGDNNQILTSQTYNGNPVPVVTINPDGLLDLNGFVQTLASLLLIGSDVMTANAFSLTGETGTPQPLGTLTLGGSGTSQLSDVTTESPNGSGVSTNNMGNDRSATISGQLSLGTTTGARIFSVGQDLALDQGQGLPDLNITATISGGGPQIGLTKMGLGTLELDPAAGPSSNTYLGTTTINEGILSAGVAFALPDQPLVINGKNSTDTGTFLLNNLNQMVGSLASSPLGGSFNPNGILDLGTATLTVGDNNASTTYGGETEGGITSAITKIGTGTLTLAGASGPKLATPFQGAVNINDGVVLFNADYSDATVNVNNADAAQASPVGTVGGNAPASSNTSTTNNTGPIVVNPNASNVVVAPGSPANAPQGASPGILNVANPTTSIQTATEDGSGNVTITTATPVQFGTGTFVTIAGFSGTTAGYNGTYQVTSGGAGTTTFTYSDPTLGLGPAGGSGQTVYLADSVSLTPATTYSEDITGTTAGTGFGQLNSTGPGLVNLGGAQLAVNVTSLLPGGTQFAIITAPSNVVGTFAGLADGATISVPVGTKTQLFTINYNLGGNPGVYLTAVGTTSTSLTVTQGGNPVANGATLAYGTAVTLTATVSPTITSSTAPTGTVTFYNDSVTISSAAETTNTVTITTASPENYVGGDTVSIANVGDANYNGTFTIASVISSTQFTYTDNAITNEAASGGGTAAQVLGAVTPLTPIPSGAGKAATATLTVSDPPLNAGANNLFAVYTPGSGADYLSSTSLPPAYQVNVNAAKVQSNTLTSSTANPTYGAPVNFTAVLVGVSGGAAPTGTVAFYSNSISAANLLGTLTAPTNANNSNATSTYQIVLNDLPYLGNNVSQNILAVYQGDQNYAASGVGGSPTGMTPETVGQGKVFVGPVSVSPSGTVTYGQPVTLTAIVTPQSGNTLPPAVGGDWVEFIDIGPNGTGTPTILNLNNHSLTTAIPNAANYAASATFVWDETSQNGTTPDTIEAVFMDPHSGYMDATSVHNPSTDEVVAPTFTAASTTTSISPLSAQPGQITFTVTVSPNSPGMVAPTIGTNGSITFTINGGPVGNGVISGNTESYTVNLGAGNYTVAAQFASSTPTEFTSSSSGNVTASVFTPPPPAAPAATGTFNVSSLIWVVIKTKKNGKTIYELIVVNLDPTNNFLGLALLQNLTSSELKALGLSKNFPALFLFLPAGGFAQISLGNSAPHGLNAFFVPI